MMVFWEEDIDFITRFDHRFGGIAGDFHRHLVIGHLLATDAEGDRETHVSGEESAYLLATTDAMTYFSAI